MPYGVPGEFRAFPTGNAAGPSSAAANLFGSENVAVGDDAGENVGTDPTNAVDGGVYIGVRAGRATQADECIIIGRDAAPTVPIGGGTNGHLGTIAIGARALNFLGQGVTTNQEMNMAIGHEAADQFGGSFCRNNLIIGFRAAAGNLQVDNPGNNVIIGQEAAERANQNTFMNNVIIGFRAARGTGVATQTVNSSVVIGSGAWEAAAIAAGSGVYIGASAGAQHGATQGNVIIGANACPTGTPPANAENVVIGRNTAIGATAQSVLIGRGISSTAADAMVMIGAGAGGGIGARRGSIVIGNQAGFSGIVGNRVLVIESRDAITTGPATPYLFGALEKACLVLGQHVDGGGTPVDRGFPLGPAGVPAGPIFCLQDVDVAAGGVGAPVTGAVGMVGIYYDSASGAAGELLAIDPAGTIVPIAAF